jgi:uncharacterized protein YndB with AHSA1/START domain
MDFNVGGRRFYAMVSPEGQEHWSIQEYTSISPTSNFKLLSSFTDNNENINDEMPSSKWDLNFNERNGTTTVSIIVKLKTLADLEKNIQMGFKEGFTMTLNYLEKLLQNLK